MIPKAPKHNRIKPKYRKELNAAETRYQEWVRQFGCLVCGAEASIHHIISDGYKRLTKDHMLVTPLCPEHHQGTQGYHGLGSDTKFRETYGIDLHQRAIEFKTVYERMNG